MKWLKWLEPVFNIAVPFSVGCDVVKNGWDSVDVVIMALFGLSALIDLIVKFPRKKRL